jgi:monofunctional biosynthetic peptidoglycan transglycosylase
MARKRGWHRWLLRSLLLLIAALLTATVVPVLLLRWVHPWTSAFMLEARIAALSDAAPYHLRYDWVDLEHISPNAAVAVIASEDQQFPFHWGFDFESIRKAIRANEEGKSVRGASTISQQVAKNLFLWSGQNYTRKALEAWLTSLIERLWPKERILEVYLNIAEFGRGTYGVEAASLRFFHKPAARLTRAEAALLAAVLPNPLRLRVDAPSRYTLQRRDWIMEQMNALGGPAYLKAIEHDEPPAASAAGIHRR